MMPHYHVVTLRDQSYLDYSDGLTEAGAFAYAADVISPTMSEREPGLEGVWIVSIDPQSCRLAHGDDPDRQSEEALDFLVRVIQGEPYWSAFE